MSDTSQVQVRIYEEASVNEAPSTSNKMTNLNITNENLVGTVATKKSAIIRNDGNVKSIGRTSTGASGALGTELVYGEYDSLFEGLLRSSFPTAVSISGTTFDAASADNSFNDSGSGFVSGNIIVGQWILVAGFTTAANNGLFKVSSVVAGKIVVTGGTLVTEAAGDSVTMKGAMLKNGTTEKSFLIEVDYGSSTFDYFRGMEVASGSVNAALDDFVNINLDFLGFSKTVATATQGDGSPTAASTKDSINTVDNLSVYIDGVLTTLDVTSFNFSISPTLREKKALGNLGAIGIGAGTFTITGNIEIHNAGNDLLTELDAFTDKALAIAVGDAAGNKQVWDFAKTKLTSGNRNTPGQDQDVITSIGFEAYLDTTTSAMVGMTRVPA